MGKLSGSQQVRFEIDRLDESDLEIDARALDELEDDELELTTGDDELEVDDIDHFDAAEGVDDEDLIDDEAEIEAGEDTGEFDSVAHYFKESARHRLLPPDRERELTQAVKRGRVASKRLSTRPIKPFASVDRKKMNDVIERGMDARGELVRGNARLVISIAKRYQNLGLPLMDLIQEGNIGLLRAIDRFEPARGLRLSTYATWWVRQAINRAVANQGRAIRLPAYLQDRLHKMYRVAQDLEQTLGRAPNDDELAATLEVAPEEVQSMRSAAVPVTSLDEPISDDEDESPLAQLEDSDIVPLDDLVARRMLREAMERALEELPARYAMIVRMRYGMDGDRPRTLEDIAQKLNLSRERVRQIERDAFTRLRMQDDVRKQRLPMAA
ncbi:MAG TPA: RNA polymerase sigma factor RpoD/SigA [Anaerolineae bacterium]|nr:RNA polymerase sigma factor RpoD/SigA [Anaerolineae bacterium]